MLQSSFLSKATDGEISDMEMRRCCRHLPLKGIAEGSKGQDSGFDGPAQSLLASKLTFSEPICVLRVFGWGRPPRKGFQPSLSPCDPAGSQ